MNNLLSDLETDTMQHNSEHLDKQANLLSTMLKDMDIMNITCITDIEPDFQTTFRETKYQIDN